MRAGLRRRRHRRPAPRSVRTAAAVLLAGAACLLAPAGAVAQDPPALDAIEAAADSGYTDSARAMLDLLPDKRRTIFSCGGGMPPEVSTENIQAFIQAVQG